MAGVSHTCRKARANRGAAHTSGLLETIGSEDNASHPLGMSHRHQNVNETGGFCT
ncbi:MAG: hypothetical protein ACYCYF_01765 [Anaerolineae bacterium]